MRPARSTSCATARSSVRRFSATDMSYSAKGAEAAIDRDNYTGHELRSRPTQPKERAHQVVRHAEASGRRVVDDALPSLGEVSLRVDQQRPILIADEKTRGDGVHAQARAVYARHLRR